MKRSLKIKAAICGVICLSAGSVYAGTYSVPSQYATIQAAINAASSNSVINVAPGTYNERLSFSTKMMLTINGTGGAAATIIDGGSTGPLLAVGPMSMANMPITMNGFTFQNGYSSVNGGVANLAATSELVILNSVVTQNQGGTGGAFSVNGGNLKIRNTVISGNTATDTGSAIYVATGKTYLVNDTITANTSADGAAINQLYGATLSGINDIVYGNLKVDGTAGTPVFNGPLTATFTYSDIEGGFTGTGNIDVAPGFVDPATGNYQLADGSAAIDSGIASSSSLLPTVATDLLGAARPQGAAYDMGAYEYVAAALPPVDGTCGSSNGGTFTIAPTANLCSTGTASTVTGTGSFAWTCDGSNGGTAASCSAQLQVVPPADTTAPEVVSVDTSGATTSNSFAFPVTFTEGIVLVTSGVRVGSFSGRVTVSGAVATIKLDQATPVKDQVYTLNIPAGTFRDAAGNLNTLYSAPVTFANGKNPPPAPVNGTCGSANGSAFEIAPTTNLCTAGTASAVTGAGPYYWSCAGINLGTSASCSAQYQAPANNTDVTPPAVASVVTNGGPTSNSFAVTVTFTEGIVLVKSGVRVGSFSGIVTVSGAVATIKLDQATPVKDQVYTLNIPAGTFRDAAGNLNALYTAPVTFANGKNPPPPTPINGVCGSANGSFVPIAPIANLCTAGTASAVTGTGPFSWSCTGSNGGTTASCLAQFSNPADVTPPATVSIVASGTTANNSSIKVTFSENIFATQALSNVVKVGAFRTIVSVSGSVATIKFDQVNLLMGTEYILTIPAGSFKDAAGNLNAIITAPVTFGTAPVPVNGACGSSNGASFLIAPTTNLCSTGTASAVTGIGPFGWTCAGSNGGTTATCSALLTPPSVDTTPPAVVSAVVTKGTTVAADVITVTFTEAVTKAKPLDSIMKIGTADTSSTVNGSTVVIKVKSCCLSKVRAGNTYNLTIPAGSFKDAAGNLNAAFSVPVKL